MNIPNIGIVYDKHRKSIVTFLTKEMLIEKKLLHYIKDDKKYFHYNVSLV